MYVSAVLSDKTSTNSVKIDNKASKMRNEICLGVQVVELNTQIVCLCGIRALSWHLTGMVMWDDISSWSLNPLTSYFREGTDFLQHGGLHTTQHLYLRVHTLCGWKGISKMD